MRFIEYKLTMKRARKDKGYNIQDISTKLFMSKSNVYNIFSGKRSSLSNVYAVADLLGIKREELLLYRLKCGVEQSQREKAVILDYLMGVGGISL